MNFRRNDRRAFSRKVKTIAYARQKDDRGLARCAKCTAALRPGHFRYDHIEPWELGRDSRLENCQVICDGCDAVKTPGDQAVIAKSNAVRDKHRGAGPRSRSPMPCGRQSRRSRTIRGRVVPRLTGAQKHARTMAARAIGFAEPATPYEEET